jgi:hypothetical protein
MTKLNAHFVRRPLRSLLTIGCLLALGVSAPAAQAGPLVASAGDCADIPLEQPFMPWLDPASYVLIPRGTFEGSTDGWQGGSVASGNEPWHVHGSGGTHSLSLPAGSSVTTPTMCVGLDEPTMRFFARSSGSPLSSLKVEVLFEDGLGNARSAPIGVVTAGPWAPTLPLPILVNLLPLLPGEKTPVQFRITPQGSANWRIDDVYVDPKRRS